MAIRLSTQSVSADTPKSDNMSDTSSWVQAKSKCDPTDPDELLPAIKKGVISIIHYKEVTWEFQRSSKAHWDFELFSSSNHISPLLNRSQGCKGSQKNWKDLRFHT
jgi:hypothetical protein